MRRSDLALVILAPLIFYGVLELAARAFFPLSDTLGECMAPDERTGWKRKPDCRATSNSFESGRIAYQFDVCGHRNIIPCGGSERVAALGDSFTEGALVDVGSVFINVAVGNVDNFAVSGWDLAQHQAIFADVLATRPAMVVLGLTTNDLFSDSISHSTAQQGWSLQRLINESRTAVALQAMVFESDKAYARAYTSQGGKADYLAVEYSPEWEAKVERAAKTLLAMKRAADEAGVAFIVVLIPQRIQAVLLNDPRYDATGLQRRIKERASGVAFVDFFDVLTKHSAPGNLYFPFDGHLTAEGHRLLGEHLAAFLSRL